MATEAQTKHTPGPWVVNDEIFVHGPDGMGIFGGASTHRSDEECAANARLIAAAPDLAAAAAAALDYFGEKGVAHIWMPLEAALRKAGWKS